MSGICKENKASRRPLADFEAAEKNHSTSLVSEHRINTMHCTCIVDSVGSESRHEKSVTWKLRINN